MGQRLDLQTELENLLGAGVMVKFQPASTVQPGSTATPPARRLQLTYPCCLYEQSNGKTTFSDNRPYTFQRKYTLTLIDRNPDTPLVEMIAMHFPKCVMDRAYGADGLNHYVFTLYY